MRQRPPFPRINRLAPLAKGLVFAGLGGGASTLMFADGSGYGNHGTLTGMDPATDWVWAEELGRRALDYDGNDDVVDVPASSELVSLTNGPLSCSFWVYWRTCTTDDWIIRQDSLTGGWWITVYNGTNKSLRFNKDLTAPSDAACVLPLNQFALSSWIHMAATWNGGSNLGGTDMQWWLNGVLQVPWFTEGGGSPRVGPGDLNLGYTSNSLDGLMADMLIHNRVLSPSEIAALADPSNVFLRCGGSSLIREPRPLRSFIGQAGGEPPAGTPWLYAHRRSARIVA